MVGLQKYNLLNPEASKMASMSLWFLKKQALDVNRVSIKKKLQ